MSAEEHTKQMADYLVRWKDRILASAAHAIDGHFLDKPIDDFTAEEEGFERGLSTAINEICKLMADSSYFNRKPNHPAEK